MEGEKTFVLCDGSTVNTYGFRIELSGMDLKRFRENPVMLYGHDSSVVIGRWKDIRVEDNRLLATPEFDDDDEQAIRVQKKVAKGYLRAASVGIVILEIKEDVKKGTMTATKTELLEASIVAVPSDRGALTLYDQNREKLSGDHIRMFLTGIRNQRKEKTLFLSDMEKNLSEYAADVKALEAEVAELKAQNADLQAKVLAAQTEKHEAFLQAAVDAGKISKEEKAQFLELAAIKFDVVKSIVDGRVPAKEASLAAQVKRGSSVALDARKDWKYFDWMEKDPQGLKRLKAEDPEAFKELQATI